jgi:hypothetical protein
MQTGSLDMPGSADSLSVEQVVDDLSHMIDSRDPRGFPDAHAAADMLAWKNSWFSIDASVRI